MPKSTAMGIWRRRSPMTMDKPALAGETRCDVRYQYVGQGGKWRENSEGRRGEKRQKPKLQISLCGPTHKDGYQEPSHPLLLDLLDAGFVSWGNGFAHDGEGIDMRDRPHSGSCEPGQAKKCRDAAKDYDDQQVQMKPRTLYKHSFFLTDDQPGRERPKEQHGGVNCALGKSC